MVIKCPQYIPCGQQRHDHRQTIKLFCFQTNIQYQSLYYYDVLLYYIYYGDPMSVRY